MNNVFFCVCLPFFKEEGERETFANCYNISSPFELGVIVSEKVKLKLILKRISHASARGGK